MVEWFDSCFNLDAQKPIQFITDSTPPSSNLGALPMHQFKKMKSNKAIFRIKHPMHSYLVEGETPDKDYLKNTIWRCSFGNSSFFEYLDSRKVLWLNLGCKGGVGAYSLIHHAEKFVVSSIPKESANRFIHRWSVFSFSILCKIY